MIGLQFLAILSIGTMSRIEFLGSDAVLKSLREAIQRAQGR